MTPTSDDQGRAAQAGLFALRLWIGSFFLLAAYPKLPLSGLGHWTFPAWLEEELRYFTRVGAHEVYRAIVEAAVAHPREVAAAVGLGEALVGLLLVLGLFTNAACALGAFLCLNYGLATLHLGYPMVGLNLTVGMSCLCLMLGRAGRYWGLDSLRVPTPPAES